MRWRRRLLRRQRKNGNSPKQTADNQLGPIGRALERGQAFRRIVEDQRLLAERRRRDPVYARKAGIRFAPQNMKTTMRGRG
jgi:hypothetical protein